MVGAMTHQSFVAARLKQMHERPTMWASTQEAFGLQLALLIEVHELYEDKKTPSHIVMTRIFGPGNTVSHEPLDDDWAKHRVELVRRMLKDAD